MTRSTRTRSLELDCLQPLDMFGLLTYATSGFKFFPAPTLECWNKRVKGFVTLGDTGDSTAEDRLAFELDDFNLDLGDSILQPQLNITEHTPNLADHRSRVSKNPTGASLTLLVMEDLPLNEKQRLVVERVLSSALAWTDHAYNSSEQDQMLLYVGGEGGVGKSQIYYLLLNI